MSSTETSSDDSVTLADFEASLRFRTKLHAALARYLAIIHAGDDRSLEWDERYSHLYRLFRPDARLPDGKMAAQFVIPGMREDIWMPWDFVLYYDAWKKEFDAEMAEVGAP